MDINEIPRGQLSTIILTTLLDGDKYGLEMIDEIEKKTFGEVVIKKPSLYSSLSRMEKQDLVSSYWKDSDIGGRRHYYRLTDYGRKQVLQWQNELLTSKTKVSHILTQESEQLPQSADKPTMLQQENLFALAKEEEKPVTPEEKRPEKPKPSTDFIQYDLFAANSYVANPVDTSSESAISQEPMVFNMKSFEQHEQKPVEAPAPVAKAPEKPVAPAPNKQEEPKQEPKPEKLVQIKHNFDFESAYEKYAKSATSYAETFGDKKQTNPFEVASHSMDGIISGQSFIETAFDKQEVEQMVEEEDAHFLPSPNKPLPHEDGLEEEQKEQQPHDDAVLITATPTEDQLPKVKKIAPATFNHGLATQKYDLQKPKDEGMREQTMQKVFIQQEMLKDYFAGKNISFRPYSKKLAPKVQEEPKPEPTNNHIAINKFNMFKGLAVFGALLAETLALLFTLRAFGLFNLSTLWLYILTATAGLGYFAYHLVVFLKNKHKKVPLQSLVQNPLWYKLMFVSILLILIYAIHMLAGMNEFNISNYLTTLLLPCILVLDYIGIHIANAIAYAPKKG